MFSKEKITDLMMVLSLSHRGSSHIELDSQGSALRQILKGFQAEQHDHRTAVLINAGLKVLDQRDWLQIQCGDLSQQVTSLSGQVYATNDDTEKERLIIEALVKIKVLAHAQIIGNELLSRVNGFMLHASTFIVGNLSRGEEKVSNEAMGPHDGAVNAQLKMLRNVVDSIVGELSICSNEVSANYFVPEDQSFEGRVQVQTLREIIDFGKKVIAQAVSLADVSINTIAMIGDLSPKDAGVRKQWLLAYAMTAATVAGACNSMVRDAFMAYGSITEVEKQGHRAPSSDSPQPGPAGPRNN